MYHCKLLNVRLQILSNEAVGNLKRPTAVSFHFMKPSKPRMTELHRFLLTSGDLNFARFPEFSKCGFKR